MTVARLRRDGVMTSDLGSEIVILDLDSSTYFSVRDTGAVLLNRLVEGASVESMAEELSTTYDADYEVALADVREFVADLTARRLLEYVDA
jgi:Coenzyme PQQ synthesis protein D (PqqD).